MKYFRKINTKRFLVYFSLFIIILLISSLRDIYWVGGDDTRLYYLYPQKFLNNFSLNLIVNNSISTLNAYGFQAHIAPLLIFLSLVQIIFPFINLQVFMYFLNIILGIFIFKKILDELTQTDNKISTFIKVLFSIYYVFSIFIFYSLFNHQLISVYLIALYPTSLYLLIRGLRENNKMYIIYNALLWSFSGVLLLSLPWLAALVIVSIPIFVELFIKYKNVFLKHAIYFIILILLLNLYWIFHVFYSYVVSNTSVPIVSLLEEGFRISNNYGIRVVSSINSVFYPLLFLYHYSIQSNNNWIFLGLYRSWYLKLIPINLLLILLLILPGLIRFKNHSYNKLIFGFLLLSFLFSVYFYTVNIGGWGINFFVFLNNKIPGFVMFRNMYDKFSPAVSFTASLALGYATTLVISSFKSKALKVLSLSVISFVVFLNIIPALRGDFFRLPMWTTNNTYSDIEELNSDYLNLAKYIENQEDEGRYLMLPLNIGNNFMIQDQYKNNRYYAGVSPLLILSGKNDYSGRLSFGIYGDEVLNSIVAKRFDELGQILKIMNVRYIVLNKDIPEELQKSYLYGTSLYMAQFDEGFLLTVLGKKMKDFGNRYSLYEVSDKLYNEKIYLNNELHSFTSDFSSIKYKKINNNEFDIKAKILNEGDYLYFLETYNGGWDLYTKDGEKVKNEIQFLAFDYANAWQLNNDTIEKLKLESPGDELEFKIMFSPYKYYWLPIIVSVGTAGILVLYIIFKVVKKGRKYE